MSLDLSLPVMTRSGGNVEILTVLPPYRALQSGRTVVAIVTVHGVRSVESYFADGRYLFERLATMDLVNVVPTSAVVQLIRDAARTP